MLIGLMWIYFMFVYTYVRACELVYYVCIRMCTAVFVCIFLFKHVNKSNKKGFIIVRVYLCLFVLKYLFVRCARVIICLSCGFIFYLPE